MAARLGGEEFGILLPDTEIDAALMVAEEIRSRVEALRVKTADGKTRTGTTISIGVVSSRPGTNDNTADFIYRADKLLYQAKANGRNQVCPGTAAIIHEPGSP
jgi:diguanylate cyclase (GGDEF)-like protein